MIRLDIVQEIGFQCPSEKVQFPDGRDKGRIALDAKLNPLPAAVCVEILLVVGVQLSLVGLVDHKALPIQLIGSEILAAVLGHEPVNDTETNGGLSDKVGHDLGQGRAGGVEALETVDNQFWLTVNFLTTGLGLGAVHGGLMGFKWT